MTQDRRRPRRGRTALPDAERKDRLIQTRVPGDLDEALREEAKKQRVTVSQLIRNVLEDTFHLVDGIVANTASLTAAVRRDAERLASSARGVGRRTAAMARSAGPRTEAAPLPARVAEVAAWQEVVVGRDTACDGCLADLSKGERALLGVDGGAGGVRVWLCTACAARL